MSLYLLSVLAAGAAAQSLGSCPLLPITTVEVQPVYYSEHIPYNTVIDPLRNGTQLTISYAPTDVVVTGYVTTTVLPGASTTSASSTMTSASSATTATSTTSGYPLPTGCIVNTTSGTTQQDIAAAIDQWRSDVVYVNGFLEKGNVYNSSDARRDAALAAYQIAVDEPCQFQTIQNAANAAGLNNNDTMYTCARDDLADVFGPGVLDNLAAIINDPDDFAAQAAEINLERCCSVLPDVRILFAKADGIFPGQQPQPQSTSVPVPFTCSDVQCSDNTGASTCASMRRRSVVRH
jgi:hypothetical protein